ncbi:SDR family NAD(P)-dependent oxidoreductase [Gordonia humi]|uniref:3-oxoacyl-[acyl-carrier protein] reductase n=1 Tax=Gordonia humi TaxID=686429 RepID=A0A840F3E4_9ACTN|nr:SDR family NAD(P)-dependent oxidoreductase [Gordonia humi]MBB4134097.1 3-oxoacyl-[acyl-carrier protein] reductase [Gordonia humi]
MVTVDETQTPRVAVVAGGAGGLGRAVCRRLVADGWAVGVFDIDADATAATVTELCELGGQASGYPGDLTDREFVAGAARDITEQFEAPTALVTLAGAVRNAVLSKITDEDFSLVLDTHLRSTLLCLQIFAPAMKKAGHGKVVTTSSVAARGTVAGISYGAAKGGIEALTRSAAIELAPFGVTVNCVAPGVVATGMFLNTPEEFRDAQLASIPMKRAAEPDEIADCVSFLTSPESSYVTGQTLTVCGGLSVGPLK